MFRQIINLVIVALIGAGAYALWNGQFSDTGSEDGAEYAEKSCIDAIRGRLGATGVRANSVRPNQGGFVVRTTATLAGGGTARVTCLTNQNGYVEDVLIEQ